MNQPPSDEDAETIVLLAYLTDCTIVEAAYAIIPLFDRSDFESTAALQIKIMEAQKRLDLEFKNTHSPPITKGE